MESLKYKDRFFRHLISAPFIYWAWIWLVLLDIFIEIYHRTCFPLYWLELVERKKYFQYKRHKLEYLNYLQKFNCAYCSYWNGLILYVREIIAQTEKYWCGIKNMPQDDLINPEHHKDFVEYWNQKAFFEKYWNESQDDECKLLS